jgi:ATP-binding cassette subfamily C exporter for protease/lipase
MIASNALVGNALRPISVLVSTWKQFADAQTSYVRLEKLLDNHPEREASHAAEVVKGQITFKNLVATATGRKEPILRGLNVTFNAGEVVAIVGPSGAGKSTLARCIIGIWPGVMGRVLLDGQDVSTWSRDELGPHLGYLPQDIELFEGTIAENIGRFGDVNPEWVIEAAQRTGIHEMVLRFPKGYDTPMGEAGGMLSGGQRQRVGLARAIYGNPALVVLDEPNANLDDVGEAALINTVKQLRGQGRTVFMVVHQRNILSVADRVLVLNDGVIKQFGPIAAAPAVAAPEAT